jgi:hypothetical protein
MDLDDLFDSIDRSDIARRQQLLEEIGIGEHELEPAFYQGYDVFTGQSFTTQGRMSLTSNRQPEIGSSGIGALTYDVGERRKPLQRRVKEKIGNVRILVRQILDEKVNFYIAGDRQIALKILEFPLVRNSVVSGWIESTGPEKEDWLVAWHNLATREIGVVYGDGRLSWTQTYPNFFSGFDVTHLGGGCFASQVLGDTRRRFPNLFRQNVIIWGDQPNPELPEPGSITSSLNDLIFLLSVQGQPVNGTRELQSLSIDTYPQANNTFSVYDYQYSGTVDTQEIMGANIIHGRQSQSTVDITGEQRSTIRQFFAFDNTTTIRVGTFQLNYSDSVHTEYAEIRNLGYVYNFRRVRFQDFEQTRNEQMLVAIAPGVDKQRSMNESQRLNENYSFIFESVPEPAPIPPNKTREFRWTYDSLIHRPGRFFANLGYSYEMSIQNSFDDYDSIQSYLNYSTSGTTVIQLIREQNLVVDELYFVIDTQEFRLASSAYPSDWKLHKIDDIDPDYPVNAKVSSIQNFYFELTSLENKQKIEVYKFTDTGDGYDFVLLKNSESVIYPFTEQIIDDEGNRIVEIADYDIK